MRIAVIGYLESGEVELTDYLEKKYFCSTLYLDEVFKDVEDRVDVKKEMIDKFMKKNISWVIEGTYENILFNERMKVADKIVIMKLNRFACLLKYINKQNAKGEKIDKQKVKDIIWYKRKKEYRKVLNSTMRRYSDKVVLIFNNAQIFMFRDII